jgi:hypothetical protein
MTDMITIPRSELKEAYVALQYWKDVCPQWWEERDEKIKETLRARLAQPEPNYEWTELSDKDAAELKEAIEKERRKPTRSEKLRDAGYTRRPKGWDKDGDEPEPKQEPQYKLVCPTCKADRTKVDCQGNRMNCGLKFEAHTAQSKPAAWMHPTNRDCVSTQPHAYKDAVPLYPAPTRSEPVIDKSMATRIATQLGWEPK